MFVSSHNWAVKVHGLALLVLCFLGWIRHLAQWHWAGGGGTRRARNSSCLFMPEFLFSLFLLPFLGIVLCIPPTLIPFWWMCVDVLQDHMCSWRYTSKEILDCLEKLFEFRRGLNLPTATAFLLKNHMAVLLFLSFLQHLYTLMHTLSPQSKWAADRCTLYELKQDEFHFKASAQPGFWWLVDML